MLLLKNSIKGGASQEDLRGSVVQGSLKGSIKGSKKSPSNRTNLLKSVLT